MKTPFSLVFCAWLTLFAQGQAMTNLSSGNPSTEDIRKPDITILGVSPKATGIITYNPDGRYLAVASDKAIQIFDTQPGARLAAQLTRTLTGHGAQILGLAFSDTNTLVSISLDQTAKIWDLETGNLLHTTELHFGKSSRFAIAPGHSLMAADASAGRVRLWNYQTGELLKNFEPSDSWPSALAFTPDGKSLVIGTEKGVLRVMDVATWIVTRTIDLDSPIQSLAASAEHIVVGYSEGTVAILNFEDQPSVPEVKKQSGAIEALAFNPKGELFASASADHTVKVWDTRTLKLLCSLQGHVAAVVAVVFSPDGQKMASMAADGSVNFWTVPKR